MSARLQRWPIHFLSVAALLVFSPDIGAVAPDRVIGFTPQQAYSSGSNESVNLYNFNLVASLSLSPSYPVSTRLSHSLTAYYNGGLQWSRDPNYSGFGRSFGRTEFHGPMGTGWRLDFGKIVNYVYDSNGNILTNPGQFYLCSWSASNYLAPGGSVHSFGNLSENLFTMGGAIAYASGVTYLRYPVLACPVPSSVEVNQGRHRLTIDPNTGMVTRIDDVAATSPAYVQIDYMTAADFLSIDPSAPSSAYNFNSPWSEIPEQSRAIKTVTDSHGRTIRMTYSRPLVAQGVTKFLLTEILVPVFGDPPATPTGRYTLHYEARTVCTQAPCGSATIGPPAGWPPISSSSGLPGVLPLLTRVELPADISGSRLSHTFDYNGSGEMSETRTPSGGKTAYLWGTETISADPNEQAPPASQMTRVIQEKAVYPDPYAAPAVAHTWRYAHNRFPWQDTCGGRSAIDKWRAIVTDPEGNDTEYRFYTTKYLPHSNRLSQDLLPPFVTPGNGAVGTVKYYKGSAKRWLTGAASITEIDPSFPGTGMAIRGEFYRYAAYEDGFNRPPVFYPHGRQTTYYDDRLTTASLRIDPNAPNGAVCLANDEMDFDIGEVLSSGTGPLEGYAWQGVTHDPNWFPSMHSQGGTTPFETTYLGNLVGPLPIQILGESENLCPDNVSSVYGGDDRKILQGGIIKEISHHGALGCIRRKNPAYPYTDPDRDILFTGDVARKETVTGGYVTGVTYQGGDPISADPNATGISGLTYSETLTYSSGSLQRRGFTGMSWYTVDQTLDPASAMPSLTRDSAGVQTTHTYDALGRALSIAPPLPEHPTTVTYPSESATFTNSSGVNITHVFSRAVEVLRGPNSADPGHLFARYDYDGAGRLVRESRRHVDDSLVQRTHAYDRLDAPTFTSEWHAAGASNPPGTTINYRDGDSAFPPSGRRDPFGRPRIVTGSDGKTRTFAYAGLKESVTVTGINGPYGYSATTSTWLDHRGNTRIVDAPEGADAVYDYDHAGRLTKVRLVPYIAFANYDDAGTTTADLRADRFATVLGYGATAQTRTFNRDALGLLRSSVEPEKGANWNRAYDPLGNVTVSEDNPPTPPSRGRITRLTYDIAGRLERAETAADPNSPFKLREVFTYANTPAAASPYGQALSRLIRVETRATGDPNSIASERELVYSGLNGRVSEERARYSFWSSGTDPWVRTVYGWDNYGQSASLRYPLPDGDLHAATELRSTYLHGFLTNLATNKATADPASFTTLATISYHPAGAPATLSFSNGVVETWSVDAMSRPTGIIIAKPPAQYWVSGTYAYDGAGNLTGIGPQVYSYDLIGRLKSSTTASMAGSPTMYSQTYLYDDYGSMTQRDGSTGLQNFTVDTSTNRLLNINPTTVNLEFFYNANGSVKTDGTYDYYYDDRERTTSVRLKNSPADLELYAYDERGWRVKKEETTSGRTFAYFRTPDGPVLSEYAMPTGTALEPHWKVDFIHALGRHIAAIENTEPTVPAGVTSSASDPGQSPSVSLQWLPSTEPDAYGYHVYSASASAAGPFTRLTSAPTVSPSFTDSPPEGSPRWYRMTTVDTASIESQETAPRKITSGDAVNPDAPASLGGELEGSVVSLSWPEVPDTGGDLVGYRVYRRLESDPPGSEVNLGGMLPVGTSSYFESTVNTQATYYYEVRTVDTAANESSPNPSVTVEWVDPGGGGGGGCQENCLPGQGALLLPPCREMWRDGGFTDSSEMIASGGGGEMFPGGAEETASQGAGEIFSGGTGDTASQGTGEIAWGGIGPLASQRAEFSSGRGGIASGRGENLVRFSPSAILSWGASLCLRGERSLALADHTGEEPDWRIVFYHTDHLGTPRVLTDEFGVVISKHALYPFGEELPAPLGTDWSIASSTNTHWFTGHERDAGVNGDYMLARRYSTISARFSIVDPLSPPGGMPGGGGLYAYVSCDPLAMIDPDGQDGCNIYRKLGASVEGSARRPGLFRHVMAATFDPTPTDDNPNGTLIDVWSWNSKGRSRFNDPRDRKVAQEAIDKGYHKVMYEGSALDSFAKSEMEAAILPEHRSNHRWGLRKNCHYESNAIFKEALIQYLMSQFLATFENNPHGRCRDNVTCPMGGLGALPPERKEFISGWR